VAVAILDTVFSNRVEQLLGRGTAKARERLLGRSLSSFSAKVDLSFCLGIIPAPLHQDIQLLNKLRNRCAHDWNSFAVTEEIISLYIEPMAMKRAINAANEIEPIFFPPSAAPKSILVSTLAALITLASLMKPSPANPERHDSGAAANNSFKPKPLRGWA
jgi:hypothetical protein